MRYEELIQTEKVDGFDINFYELEEDISPADVFDADDINEINEKIENGEYVWFCAKVTASKNGIELADDYLGGCCYNSAEEFCTTYKEDYYRDMVETVIKEAKENIKKLNS
jgi:hypothetical protein